MSRSTSFLGRLAIWVQPNRGKSKLLPKLAQEYFHDVLAGQDADSFGSLIDHLKSTAGDELLFADSPGGHLLSESAGFIDGPPGRPLLADPRGDYARSQ